MAPTIPDRWLDYKPMGKRIEGTRFIAFKVPLREQVSSNVDQDKRLDGRILLQKLPNLGMIIDLTNTDRYYDPHFFVHQGLKHSKLMIPGHHTPAPHLVKQFKNLVKTFLDKNLNNDKLIGVHCTHGVNRTGYLICSYMISELAMQPEDAIAKFAAARGHQIERKNYIDSLNHLTSTDNTTSNTTYKSALLLSPVNHAVAKTTPPEPPVSWRVHPEPLPPPATQVFDRRDRYERCRQDVNVQSQSYGGARNAGSYTRSYNNNNAHNNRRFINAAQVYNNRFQYVAPNNNRKPYERTPNNTDYFHRNRQYTQRSHSNQRNQTYRKERL